MPKALTPFRKQSANMEAETALLGSVLIEPSILSDVRKILTREDFFLDAHRYIFDAMCHLEEAKQSVDLVTLEEDLSLYDAPNGHNPDGKTKMIDFCGGTLYLMNLMESPSTHVNYPYYARIIVEHSNIRKIKATCVSIYQDAQQRRKDVSELLVDINSLHVSIINRMPEKNQVNPIVLDSVQKEEITWLWPGWIPFGKLTLLCGDPGLYKSGIAFDIAARFSTGRPQALNTVAMPPGNVLLLISEDGIGDTVRPRIEVAGGDLKRIHVFTTDVLPEWDIVTIERVVRQKEIKLLVLDPLFGFLPEGADGKTSSGPRRKFLNPLVDMANRLGLAIIGLFHLNKGGPQTAGGASIYRVSGRLDFAAVARSVILCAKDPLDEERFVMAPIKMNLCKPPDSLRYHVEEEDHQPRVAWDGVADNLSANGLLVNPVNNNENQESGNAMLDAQQFLLEELQNGSQASSDLQKKAKEAGISWRTISRIKDSVARSVRKGNQNERGVWHIELLPEESRELIQVTKRKGHLSLTENSTREASGVNQFFDEPPRQSLPYKGNDDDILDAEDPFKDEA